ncbi:hypothetical protein [Subtercola endophyticus]|uniref:hypothetical protein n=1 Tax=Subtercola endophyticus TaxID=2895559 RepID=UPI001E3EBA57|nr:hypothetical protein [Subtercola endophyticus]UFS58900.1 hypothetical protein LQ955_18185 [Subtercola endophyticus]
MIGDEVAALQVEVARGAHLPGTEEQFESTLRDATIGRLSLSATVRADLVLPYALEVRLQPSVEPRSRVEMGRNGRGFAAENDARDAAPAPGRPREWAVMVRNDPDAPVPYVRVALSSVTPAHRLPTADDDLAVELFPGEYFVELRRGSSWAEVEHPVPLNRVSYYTERQAAGRAG